MTPCSLVGTQSFDVLNEPDVSPSLEIKTMDFSETTLPIYHTTRHNFQRWASTTNTNRFGKTLFRGRDFHCEMVGTYKYTAQAKRRASDVKTGSQQCA